MPFIPIDVFFGELPKSNDDLEGNTFYAYSGAFKKEIILIIESSSFNLKVVSGKMNTTLSYELSIDDARKFAEALIKKADAIELEQKQIEEMNRQ